MVGYPYNRISFSKKKPRADMCSNTGKSWKDYAKGKRPVTKDHRLHDSIGMDCPEKAKL